MEDQEFHAPDYFDPNDWIGEEKKRKIYKNTSLGKWVLGRNDSGEIALPLIAEVVPIRDELHSVAWVYRHRNSSIELPLHQHQVVCDCVIDLAPKDVDKGHFACQAVDKFIQWGAEITRRRKGLDTLLEEYRGIQEGALISDSGAIAERDNVLEQLIQGLLIEGAQDPKEWTGNMVSGSHIVTGLSHIFKQPRERTLLVTKQMERSQLIDLEEDEVVRLRAA